MDLISGINKYENGEMNVAEVVHFFQHLVDTGVAWELQGSYGRTAQHLIEEGMISVGGEEELVALDVLDTDEEDWL